MINRVVLVGRLTKDVEVRKTTSGISTASFTLACNRRFTSKDSNGQTADFINCVAWRQQADFLGSYAHKGNIVGIEGRIATRSYDGQNGKVYVTEVVCDSVRLIGNNNTARDHSQGYTAPQRTPEPSAYNPNDAYDDDFSNTPSLDISSDDLPFY